MAAIIRKEFLHLRRDHLTGGMVGGIPIMMTVLFGFAINQDVRHLVAGVADLAGTQRSRTLVADAEATQVVDVRRRVGSVEELEELLVNGEISVGILVPRDFERRAEHRLRPAAQLLANGSDPVVVGAVRGLEPLPVESRAARDARASAPTFATRIYFNPERRTALFIVPGLMGMILTLTMVLFTSVAIVREREAGNLEFLITTPIQTRELMVGKIVPYVLIGFVQVTLILLLGILLFDLPVRGRLADLYAGAMIYILATLGLGLLFSTIARSQFQAFQMTFVSFLPQILLSGFMFPFEGMPGWAQWIGEVVPLTHFLRIVRGVVLRGAALGDVWSDVWPLLVFFAAAVGLAMARFRKRLD
jgi:ABC-2 type transport system permease protein